MDSSRTQSTHPWQQAPGRLSDYNRLWASHQRIFTRLDVLQERIGHTFADLTLLYEALTHRSALMELGANSGSHGGAASTAAQPTPSAKPLDLPWNERLEFLGDAVLGLAVSRQLMERSETLAEGELSRIRASLVNEESLADVARGIGLGKFLVMGKGAAASGGRNRDSLLADALEAVVGAVFVDAGFSAADAVVTQLFGTLLTGDLGRLIQTDFKTQLQELTQERLKQTPIYTVVAEAGPDHAKTFTVKVLVNGEELGQGEGASKKRASQEAAHQAVLKLRQDRPAASRLLTQPGGAAAVSSSYAPYPAQANYQAQTSNPVQPPGSAYPASPAHPAHLPDQPAKASALQQLGDHL